jgi:hypothetical protein
MKLNLKTRPAHICLWALCLLSTAFAGAQVSSPLGGSLSQPLDSNSNGVESSVAPFPSSEIEPGASSLLTPDEHILPYDAIGASLEATPLSPSLIQYDLLTRVPFQVDNSLRDASVVTGLHTPAPITIVNEISRKPGQSGFPPSLQLPASTFSRSPMNQLALPAEQTLPGANNVLPGAPYQQSSWTVGSTAFVPTIDPLQPSVHTNQAPEQPVTSGRNNTLLEKKKPKDQIEKNDSVSQAAEQTQDYGKSALEAFTIKDQGSVQVAPSPFESIDKNSFLNPDIVLAASHRNASARRRTGTSSTTQSRFSTRAESEHLGPETNRLMRDQGVTRTESRLMKESSSAKQAKKPRWHNPILQQIDSGPNSVRQ